MNHHEANVRKCLSITDNDKALDCLLDAVAKTTGDSCRPRMVMLTASYCESCKEEMALHAKAISKGLIVPIDIHSSEGREIAAKNKIDWTPALIPLDCNNKLIEPA